MVTIFQLTAIIEPDRQRFVQLAMDAVAALGGNVFSATATLDSLLQQLRKDTASAAQPTDVALFLSERTLYIGWHEHRHVVALLNEPPADAEIAALSERLKHASEAADTELLKRRNLQISQDLEQAKARAQVELKQLEAALDTKKSELQESLRLAEIDALTGLYNRGAYDHRLQQALARCRRQGEPLCLVLLDLDKFKEINDTHGHQYGDEYLKRMARALRAAVREHVDHPCRMGGDEFAIVLFAEMDIAKRVAQKILDGMENRVSIGIAKASREDTVEKLVARTDAALYEAKHRGRGQFVAVDDDQAKVA